MEFVTKIYTAAKAKWDTMDAGTKLMLALTVAGTLAVALWLS